MRKRQEWSKSRGTKSESSMLRTMTNTTTVEPMDTWQLLSPTSELVNSYKYLEFPTSAAQSPVMSPMNSPLKGKVDSPASDKSKISYEKYTTSPHISPVPLRKKIPTFIRANSKELWNTCTPKFFRRRSNEHLTSRRNRSQSPRNTGSSTDYLQSPEVVRRLSDCSPVTKSGFQHKLFKDPYYSRSPSPNTEIKTEQLCEPNTLIPGISFTVIQTNDVDEEPKDEPSSKTKTLRPDMKLGSTSFDKDEVKSEVQELPSNMPRRKSRTGIFDGIYTSFTTTRQLRLVHQLSMDETRSDVYIEFADLASSQSTTQSPPLPYVGDLDSILHVNARRRHFKRPQPYSAPTSLDGQLFKNAEGTVSYCLDSVLGTATLMNYDLGEWILK